MLSPTLRAPSILPLGTWDRSLGALRRSPIARPAFAPLPDLAVRFVIAMLAGIILSTSGTSAPVIRLDRSTPAWARVTREIRAQGLGNCYHAALTLAMDARALGLENVSVIQGTLMGEGTLEGVRFGHSWVEADIAGGTTRVAVDYSSGNSLVMDRDAFRFLQRAQDVHEYSVPEARSLAANGDYGPWTADVLNAWHP
jgi:hypothetical protein